MNSRIPSLLLLCSCLALCACVVVSGAEAEAAKEERVTEGAVREVDEAGVETYVSCLRMLVERDGKREATTIVAANSPVILECKAWATDAEVTEVIFRIEDQKGKVLASGKGARLEKTDYYEAKVMTPDMGVQVFIDVVVKAQANPQAEKPVKPPKPPAPSEEF